MALKMARREPTSVGRFELQEKLGAGGMGTVYRGLDRETGETVAVKVLGAKLAENPKLHYRFVQEFRAASQARPPEHRPGPRLRAGRRLRVPGDGVRRGATSSAS